MRDLESKDGIFSNKFTEHNCQTEHRQCYWEELNQAQEECDKWSKCKMIYESDVHSPASPGRPVYWARGGGKVEVQVGGVLWMQGGKCSKY